MDKLAVNSHDASETPLGEGDLAGRRSGSANLAGRTGLLPRQDIRALVHRKVLRTR